jgi:hypothetical protein
MAQSTVILSPAMPCMCEASFSAWLRVMVLSGPRCGRCSRSTRNRAPWDRALGEDDEIEDRPPQEPRRLDDAPVGEELLQVAAHGPVARSLGGAEIEEEHADPPRPHGRMVERADARAVEVGWTDMVFIKGGP